MSRKSTSTYLENTLGLLVEHFGTGRVRSALAKVSNGAADPVATKPHRHQSKPGQQVNPSVTSVLQDLRSHDPEKYHLLSDFYARLKEGAVLPESLDIRYFAQMIGLKDVAGKSRKDMMPKLMRALLNRPNERLRADIDAATNVSEQHRRQGFSVLTDKMLSGMDRDAHIHEGIKTGAHLVTKS